MQMQYKTILLTPTPFQIVIQPTYIEILGLPACTIEIFLRMYKLFCKLIFLVIIFLEYLSLVYKYRLGKKKNSPSRTSFASSREASRSLKQTLFYVIDDWKDGDQLIGTQSAHPKVCMFLVSIDRNNQFFNDYIS